MGRTYAIGDIHGCIEPLTRLFEARIAPDPVEDTIVFLGDYIDRGPASNEVVAFLLGLKRRFRRLIFLMGNHEQMLFDFLEGQDRGIFLFTGGEQTLASYGCASGRPEDALRAIPADHRLFLNNLLLTWEDNHAIYVHAGLKPGTHRTMQPREWLLWAREDFIDADVDFGKVVVYGHTWSAAPRIDPRKIGIDTGAVYGGALTCLVLPEREFIHEPSRRHWPPDGIAAP